MLSAGEAFFGWGEWCRTPETSPRFPPPEKFSPLRVDEFLDFPSGEMGSCVRAAR